MLLKRTVSLAVLLALATGFGCSRNSGGGLDKADAGAAIGGTLGAAVGLAVALTEAGVRNGEGAAMGFFAGGMLGSLIGHHMEIKQYKDEISRLKKERDDLKAQLDACRGENQRLKEEIARLNARIAELEARPTGGRNIESRQTIEANLLFASGSAKLTKQGQEILDGVAGTLGQLPADRNINIEGHTDDQPIRRSNWKSNWELGAARALAIVHYLQDKHGFAGARLSATTFSEYHPVTANQPGGTQENRRAVIVVWTESTPLPAAAN